MKKNSKVVLIILYSLLILALLYVGLAIARFTYDSNSATFSQVINQKDKSLIIVYRPNCDRCKRTIPALMLKHALSPGREYVLNANKLSPLQQDELCFNKTPSFIYKDISLETTNLRKVDALWDKSH